MPQGTEGIPKLTQAADRKSTLRRLKANTEAGGYVFVTDGLFRK